jgi:hypothetical protein
MTTVIAPLSFVLGIIFGILLADKASKHDLYSARANGLRQGRNEREWEINRLQNRVTHLEAKVREVAPPAYRNKVAP